MFDIPNVYENSNVIAAFNNYLKDPNDQNANKIQEVVTNVLNNDPAAAARSFLTHIDEYRAKNENEKKLNDMIENIVSVRLSVSPPNVLNDLGVPKADEPLLGNEELEKLMDKFFKENGGKNSETIAKFLEKNQSKISPAKRFELAKEAGTSLTKLDLSGFIGFVGLTDERLGELIKACPNLKELILKNSHAITNNSVENLNKLKNLRLLNITNCSITDDALTVLKNRSELEIINRWEAS